jgi:hypothetical protein
VLELENGPQEDLGAFRRPLLCACYLKALTESRTDWLDDPLTTHFRVGDE